MEDTVVQAEESLQPAKLLQPCEAHKQVAQPAIPSQPVASQLPDSSQQSDAIASASCPADGADKFDGAATATVQTNAVSTAPQEPVAVASLTQDSRQELMQRFTAEQQCWRQIAEALSPLSDEQRFVIMRKSCFCCTCEHTGPIRSKYCHHKSLIHGTVYN